jgi:hypothetical protein
VRQELPLDATHILVIEARPEELRFFYRRWSPVIDKWVDDSERVLHVERGKVADLLKILQDLSPET